jgi:hypothetical protein
VCVCVCVQHILAAERATRTLQMCNGFGLAFTRNDLWIEAQDIVTLAIADEAQRRASGEHIASRGTSWWCTMRGAAVVTYIVCRAHTNNVHSARVRRGIPVAGESAQRVDEASIRLRVWKHEAVVLVCRQRQHLPASCCIRVLVV